MLSLKGLTLIELLVTLAVAAILITVGVPAMTSLLERFRAQDAVSQWRGDLVYARQVAAAYQTSVTVCPMAGTTSCDGDWTGGYTAFIDVNSNGTLDAEDESLHQRDAINDQDHINPTAPPQIRFTEDGFSEDSGILIYCPGQTDSTLSLGLSVSSTGQTRQLENGLTCN
jgi:prepilin-type N-terminal cleavage/methylation domain-containing protein